jgi:hypothetical protein
MKCAPRKNVPLDFQVLEESAPAAFLTEHGGPTGGTGLISSEGEDRQFPAQQAQSRGLLMASLKSARSQFELEPSESGGANLQSLRWEARLAVRIA